jgi:hypothetical protein
VKKTDVKAPDWERIEAEYRVGVKSLREIGSDHGVTEGAIRKRAKKDDWTRDLSAKVRIKAEELVRKAQVRSQVRKESPTERETVEAAALDMATVRIAHRTDITRMRALVLRLLSECEAEAAEPGVFAELGDMLRAPDERGQDRLNEAYQKAISLPVRIKGVKELADTMKTLIGLEREAYGITDANAPAATMPDAGLISPEMRQEAYLRYVSGHR